MTGLDLLRKGLRNPEQVPPFVLGRLFPGSRWSPDYRHEDGFVTFEDGGFAGGSPTRPELSARIYYEIEAIDAALDDRSFDRSLEIGCGYGRLSGWFADRADEAVAIEPNAVAVGRADALYADVEFATGLADDLPFPDDSFDLVASWIVLSHVRPDDVAAAADELVRVLAPDGVLLACEHTGGQPGTAVWPRPLAEYEALLDPLELAYTGDRGTEPTFDYADRTTSMVFEARE